MSCTQQVLSFLHSNPNLLNETTEYLIRKNNDALDFIQHETNKLKEVLNDAMIEYGEETEYDDEFDSESGDDEENFDEEVAFIRCVNKYFQKVELNETAVKKHLHPACNSDLDAIKFSESKKRRRTLTNTVIKAEPSDFHFCGGNQFLISIDPVQYLECKKISYKGKFKVRDKGKMIAYFDGFKNGHFDGKRSQKIKISQKLLKSEKIRKNNLEMLENDFNEKRTQKKSRRFQKVKGLIKVTWE